MNVKVHVFIFISCKELPVTVNFFMVYQISLSLKKMQEKCQSVGRIRLFFISTIFLLKVKNYRNYRVYKKNEGWFCRWIFRGTKSKTPIKIPKKLCNLWTNKHAGRICQMDVIGAWIRSFISKLKMLCTSTSYQLFFKWNKKINFWYLFLKKNYSASSDRFKAIFGNSFTSWKIEISK